MINTCGKLVQALFITCFFLLSCQLKAAHGVDLYGSLKYPADFTHFDYVNPDAPKGGNISFAAIGTFDSLNPFVIKGTPAGGMSMLHPSMFYATLMAHSADEPISAYGYIAEDIEVAPDRTSVIFTLRSEAQFHDGSPITPEDVVFSFNILKEKGQPIYKAYYREVIRIEKLDKRRVKFTFASGDNKELPVIIGEFPILSKKYYQTHNFAKASMEIPLGSGPYKISKVDNGQSITYQRVNNWWGENLPVNKGQHNIDTIKYLYFRDDTVAFQALQSGECDFRMESSSKNWATSYTFPAVKDGNVKKLTVPHQSGQGMMGLAFNLRRPLFQDIRVRQALALLFDFEWTNENIFHSLYKRTNSYFANSELASIGLPSEKELELLLPHKKQLPETIFTQAFKMPVTDGSGNIRPQLRQAKKLLQDAGWIVKNHQLVNAKTGQPFKFKILITQPNFERLLHGFIRNLKRLGIQAKMRVVDSSQYVARMDEFDFDMVPASILQSESPGNEQREFWHSKLANVKGSRNYMGIANPVIDELIEQIIDAPTREELVQRTHALDRVLLHNYYIIPLYHNDKYFLAHWRHLQHPDRFPKYAIQLSTWWVDREQSKDLAEKHTHSDINQGGKPPQARS